MEDANDPVTKRRRVASLMNLDVESYEFRKYEEWAFELSETLCSVGEVDEKSGMPEDLVQEAKENELASMRNMDVFEVIPLSEVERDHGVVWIDCRWVVTNKGTDTAPVAKARLVAREFADQKRNDLYAGTPGLGFIKMRLAAAARNAPTGAHKKLMTPDVKTAVLYGEARRRILVTLPRDISSQYDTPVVGRLKKALYGTRDAPMIWGDHLRTTLEDRVQVFSVDARCFLLRRS